MINLSKACIDEVVQSSVFWRDSVQSKIQAICCFVCSKFFSSPLWAKFLIIWNAKWPKKVKYIFWEYKMLCDKICLNRKRANWNFLKFQMRRSSLAKKQTLFYSKWITQMSAQKCLIIWITLHRNLFAPELTNLENNNVAFSY